MFHIKSNCKEALYHDVCQGSQIVLVGLPYEYEVEEHMECHLRDSPSTEISSGFVAPEASDDVGKQ